MDSLFKGISVLLLSVPVMVTLYEYVPADSGQIQQLIDKADGDEAAMKLVSEFFQKHPSPTVSELIHTKNEVDTVLVKHATEVYRNQSNEKITETAQSPVELPINMPSHQESSLDKAAYACGMVLLIALIFYAAIYVFQRLRQARDQS